MITSDSKAEHHLVANIDRFLQAKERPADIAETLLRAAADLIKEIAEDRDAAWRFARAAADGHDHNRQVLADIARALGGVDDWDTLPGKVYELKERRGTEQGNTIAQLKDVLTMAGAPEGRDLMAWASDVRNRALGRQAQLDDMVKDRRDYYTARENELAEFRAAAESLPDALKPANGYPYTLMASTPIQVFMLLRERALALVNLGAAPPVSGA